MDTFHTGLLFRVLIVLLTICLLVIAGLVIARREKRRASNPHSVHRTNAARGPAAIAQACHRYTPDGDGLEANDAEISARTLPRRAA